MKDKIYKAKLHPLYSLQFYKNRQGTLCFLETSNIKDGTEPLDEDSFNLEVFGEHLEKSELLTTGDKKALAGFFKEFIRKSHSLKD